MYWYSYKITWCDQCDKPCITCEECLNSSCDNDSCEFCEESFHDFRKTKWSKISSKEDWEDILSYG